LGKRGWIITFRVGQGGKAVGRSFPRKNTGFEEKNTLSVFRWTKIHSLSKNRKKSDESNRYVKKLKRGALCSKAGPGNTEKTKKNLPTRVGKPLGGGRIKVFSQRPFAITGTKILQEKVRKWIGKGFLPFGRGKGPSGKFPRRSPSSPRFGKGGGQGHKDLSVDGNFWRENVAERGVGKNYY